MSFSLTPGDSYYQVSDILRWSLHPFIYWRYIAFYLSIPHPIIISAFAKPSCPGPLPSLCHCSDSNLPETASIHNLFFMIASIFCYSLQTLPALETVMSGGLNRSEKEGDRPGEKGIASNSTVPNTRKVKTTHISSWNPACILPSCHKFVKSVFWGFIQLSFLLNQG